MGSHHTKYNPVSPAWLTLLGPSLLLTPSLNLSAKAILHLCQACFHLRAFTRYFSLLEIITPHQPTLRYYMALTLILFRWLLIYHVLRDPP